MQYHEIKEKDSLEHLTEELLFAGLSQSAPDVYIFKGNVKNGYTVWSENAVKYFGFPDGYEENFTEIWIPHIHSDDRDDYVKDLTALFAGEKEHHHFQYRALNAQGEYVWLECDGKVIEDEQTGDRFFVGLINRLDITGKYDPVSNCINTKEFYLTEYNRNCVLMLVGIDRFRQVINQIGFSASNRVLSILGSVLQESTDRNSVFRMTGDEFLVLLPELSIEEVAFVFENVQNTFQKRIFEKQKGLRVTFSGGAIFYRPFRDNKEDVIQKLENCLSYAKQQGVGVFTKYSAVVDEKNEYLLKLQNALMESVENQFEGFRLVYQPVVVSKTQEIDGAEALLRFYTDELGLISPADFIPLLEANGDIIPVGRWVAETAIRQKAQWDKIQPGLRVGFNVSLLQLRDRSLPEHIVELIHEYDIKPDEIIVELTETRGIGDPEAMREVLSPLVEAGVWIFLDDFGMEASNFTLVKELEVNGIKVDHSFVCKMAKGGSDRENKANIAIVSSITYLARSLGLRVIVEGVENAQIDEIVYNMGIRYTQGYFYSRPISVEEIEEKWIDGRHMREKGLDLEEASVGSYPKITVAELEVLMRQLSKIYDVVRIVDVGMMRVLTYGENGVRQVTEQVCHEIWGRCDRCKNCISALAFREKNRMTKFEFIGHEVYHVTSQYMVVNGEPCILEIVEKNIDAALFGAYGRTKFVDTIKEYSDHVYTDSLTKVSNRKYLDEQLLSLEMDALAMVDIDNFKEINDTNGHICGDEVLFAVAQTICKNVRGEDCVVRYGGDEFLIAFSVMKPGCLYSRLEAVRKAIESLTFEGHEGVKASISIGGVQKRRKMKELLPVSDRALYLAKERRNHVTILENDE